MAHKTPGRSHREGISLIELFEMFPDDDTAERWFEQQRWGAAGKPSHCPMCGSHEKLKPSRDRKPLPYWCGGCRRHFSVRTGTIMHRSKIPLQKWVIAIYLWSVSLKGVSSMRLHRDLDIGQQAAYFMAMRLREAWSDRPGNMHSPVDVDESYFGGKRKNMSNAKRRTMKDAGRGSVGKTTVAGIRDRDTNNVTAKVVERTDKPTLQGFIRENIETGARIYTDEAKAYKGMPEYEHESVNHSTSEYVRDMAHTNGVESFWAVLKRAYHGTFHHISPKHLHRYVNEFATRHNIRDKDTIDMMNATVARMVGKRLMYKQLVK